MISLVELDKTNKTDPRYENGKCSNFKLFESDFRIIKSVAEDLMNIMKQTVKSDIYIFESFLNIYEAGSSATPHAHISEFDKT